jgi:AcrR family transcriptional regulator
VGVEHVKSRRTEYAELTRAALLDAAARAFAERGFAATSVTEIAASARVTKGAVYHHFPDKRSLFEAVVQRCDEAAQQKVYDAVANHSDSPWDAAMAALEATLEVCSDPVAARLIYVEGPVGLGWRRWRECEDHYTYRNARLMLQSLIDAGIYRDDIPIDAMSQVVTGIVTHAGITLAEASPRNRKRIRRELQMAIQDLMYGLSRTRSGEKAAPTADLAHRGRRSPRSRPES